MSEDLRSIARRLDDVARSVPGVATLFAADPALLQAAKRLAAGGESSPLTTVSRAADTLTVTISVGVRGELKAPDTAAAVASAVKAALPESNVAVLVRVSRVAQ